MPFINGRFYANPAYGRTLERARRSNSGGIWSEDFPEQDRGIDEEGSHRRDATQAVQHSGRAVHPKHHGTDDFDAATTTAGITNQIYNETASLRPTSESGNGSDVELQRARLAMAHVIHNRAAIKMPGGLASDQLNSREATAVKRFPPQHSTPLAVPATCRWRSSSPVIPRRRAIFLPRLWTDRAIVGAGKEPVAVFGPFRNTIREKNANRDQSIET